MINSVNNNAGWQIHTRSTGTGTSPAQNSANAAAAAPERDSYIKSDASAKSMPALYTGPQAPAANATTLRSSKGEMAGAGNSNISRYLNYGGGFGDIGLDTMNANRKRLGDRIATAIESAGVTLGAKDKLTISVDGKNNIVVGGIKDAQKAKAIQDALNGSTKLAGDLRKHVAAGTLAGNAKMQKAYESETGKDGTDAYTNRGMRAFIMDEYLMESAGVSLDRLSATTDADGNVVIGGANAELELLMAEDSTLAATIGNILENGETALEFSASFEYANGALSDSTTLDAATEKLDGIKSKLMGGYNRETGQLEPGILMEFYDQMTATGANNDEEFMNMLAKGFSIRVDSSGGFEIANAENLDSHLRNTLEGLVQKALEEWSGEMKVGGSPDPSRKASLRDVAETFVEQHRFEHGDVDEYEHLLEIDFAAHGDDAYRVVSPAADEARHAANQQTADALGGALRGMLEEKDIDSAGLEFEIDDAGKITVLGDPTDANVRQAQAVVDQFVTEAKSAGGPVAGGDEEEEGTEAEAGAQGLRDSHAEANGMGGVVARGEKSVADLRPNEGEVTGRVLWKFPKHDQSVQNGSTLKSVSDIIPEWSPMSAANRGGGTGGGTEAHRLYGELLAGMEQFHDPKSNLRYSFAA